MFWVKLFSLKFIPFHPFASSREQGDSGLSSEDTQACFPRDLQGRGACGFLQSQRLLVSMRAPGPRALRAWEPGRGGLEPAPEAGLVVAVISP